jgi:hypothetical protein
VAIYGSAARVCVRGGRGRVVACVHGWGHCRASSWVIWGGGLSELGEREVGKEQGQEGERRRPAAGACVR